MTVTLGEIELDVEAQDVEWRQPDNFPVKDPRGRTVGSSLADYALYRGLVPLEDANLVGALIDQDVTFDDGGASEVYVGNVGRHYPITNSIVDLHFGLWTIPTATPALIQATTNTTGSGGNLAVRFANEPSIGNLLLVYAFRRDNGSDEPEDLQGGWEEIATMYPYIGTGAPGRLFSRICDGSESDPTGGGEWATGLFGPCDKFLATEWNGISSATPTDVTGPTAWADAPSGGTLNIRQSVTTTELAIMILHGKTFGANTMTAVSPSTEAIAWGDADWPAQMVYRIGSGSLENGIDYVHGVGSGYQYVSVAFA